MKHVQRVSMKCAELRSAINSLVTEFQDIDTVLMLPSFFTLDTKRLTTHHVCSRTSGLCKDLCPDVWSQSAASAVPFVTELSGGLSELLAADQCLYEELVCYARR